MPRLARSHAIVEETVAQEANVTELRPEHLRLLEAMLFASSEPLDAATLAERLPDEMDVEAALAALQLEYATRGVNLVRIAGKWTFRTANDLSWLLSREAVETRKLSRAALETLAIVAYHQPVTRAEIEDIRGVSASKGTLDVLLETGWIRPRGRRKAPGRPLTFGTTEAFLAHFGLENLTDLPGLEELKGAGLFDGRLPSGFAMPAPSDDPALREDEETLAQIAVLYPQLPLDGAEEAALREAKRIAEALLFAAAEPVEEMPSEGETPQERPEELRLIEALLFAAGEPLDEKTLRSRLPEGEG